MLPDPVDPRAPLLYEDAGAAAVDALADEKKRREYRASSPATSSSAAVRTVNVYRCNDGIDRARRAWSRRAVAGPPILLLNYALMRPEPVAQIVFAVSAVESLGQDETWTADQKKLLKELATAAAQSSTGTDAERQEVADALRKSLHRLTLRQGVFRLLDRLGLADLKKPWDELYAERSTLVHGLARQPGADYTTLANRTLSLCGQILLRAVAAEIPMADRHVSKFYAG